MFACARTLYFVIYSLLFELFLYVWFNDSLYLFNIDQKRPTYACVCSTPHSWTPPHVTLTCFLCFGRIPWCCSISATLSRLTSGKCCERACLCVVNVCKLFYLSLFRPSIVVLTDYVRTCLIRCSCHACVPVALVIYIRV